MPGGAAQTLTLVQLEPPDRLTFQKVHNDAQPNSYTSCVTLRLTNKGAGNVAFKVKTTAPKAYLVRPSSGTLGPAGGPRGETEVSIILQLTGNDTATGTSNHRFLVQAAPVESDAAVSKEQWALFPKEVVEEQRLSVHLEEAQTQQTSAAYANPPAEASGAAAEARSRDPPQRAAPPAEELTHAELKQKYAELSQYCKNLESQKEKLQAEKRKLEADKSKGRPSDGEGTWSNWSVMILMSVVVVVVAYLTKATYAVDRAAPGPVLAEAVQTPPRADYWLGGCGGRRGGHRGRQRGPREGRGRGGGAVVTRRTEAAA